MTPEETICEFMQPRTDCADWPFGGRADFWWRAANNSSRIPAGWEPRPLTLDRLREVEERLTEGQWTAYEESLRNIFDVMDVRLVLRRQWVHASAEQKIAALATVIGGRKWYGSPNPLATDDLRKKLSYLVGYVQARMPKHAIEYPNVGTATHEQLVDSIIRMLARERGQMEPNK